MHRTHCIYEVSDFEWGRLQPKTILSDYLKFSIFMNSSTLIHFIIRTSAGFQLFVEVWRHSRYLRVGSSYRFRWRLVRQGRHSQGRAPRSHGTTRTSTTNLPRRSTTKWLLPLLQGTVIIIANHGDRIDIPSGTILENKIVSGNLRILDHWSTDKRLNK